MKANLSKNFKNNIAQIEAKLITLDLPIRDCRIYRDDLLLGLHEMKVVHRDESYSYKNSFILKVDTNTLGVWQHGVEEMTVKVIVCMSYDEKHNHVGNAIDLEFSYKHPNNSGSNGFGRRFVQSPAKNLRNNLSPNAWSN